MHAIKPPEVLILARSAETARGWSEALAGSVKRVWLTSEDPSDGAAIDVVLTDLDSKEEVTRRIGQLARSYRPGIVAVGNAAWADVAVADGCSTAELNLACTLVGEVARLRHECERTAQSHQEVRDLAYTDPLTALANRRAWDAELEVMCRMAEGGTTRFALAVVDLDRFKAVNDVHGLAEGDRMLTRVAKSLARAVRRDDLVARLGGDEFGVLLSGVGDREARAVLERLRGAVAASQARHRVTASVGYALAEQGRARAAELFAAAERGLKQAKASGGNRVCPDRAA